MKIGGSIGKIANGTKKANIKDVGAAILTGGASTQVTAATGKTVDHMGDLTKTPSLSAVTKAKAAPSTDYMNQSNGLLNPVADQFNTLGQNSAVTSNVDPAFRDYQLGLAQQLQSQANGQGPSLAQMQLQQATDKTMNQSLGAIRSATGANAGLSARTAALSAAQGLGTAANASGQLRLQEQQAAQTQLAALSAQGRTGDLSGNAQSIQAQQYTNANKLAAIQGLAGVRNAQLGTAKTIYDAQNQAAIATSGNQNKLAQGALGGLVNIAATGAGAYMGGPAGAAAGAAAGGAINNAIAPDDTSAVEGSGNTEDTTGAPIYDPNKQLA